MAYAFVDGVDATEIPDGVAFESPITGRTFPPNWLDIASQAEREAENCWPIVEPPALVWPEEVDTETLVVTAGPVITRTWTLVDKSVSDQLSEILTSIDTIEVAWFNTSFTGIDGNGGYVQYPLNAQLRDMIGYWGHVATHQILGRRAEGFFDFAGDWDLPEENAEFYINGVTFTAKTGAVGQYEIEMQANTIDFAVHMAVVLNACTDQAVAQASYGHFGYNQMRVIHNSFSAAGNNFTLGVGTSPDPKAALSASTLLYGADPGKHDDNYWSDPIAANEFGLTDVDGNKVPLDAYELQTVVKNLAYFTDFVSGYARTQRLAARTAAGASPPDTAGLLAIYQAVTADSPSNWDPGTPPTWP